ncbi:MAG: hypothetical protein MZV70_66575 [Desulfobacterales bacterium]|nr:hypothetical protein [Desulfobacterales bacterium]
MTSLTILRTRHRDRHRGHFRSLGLSLSPRRSRSGLIIAGIPVGIFLVRHPRLLFPVPAEA